MLDSELLQCMAELETTLLPCPFCGSRAKVIHLGRRGWMRTEVGCTSSKCFINPTVSHIVDDIEGKTNEEQRAGVVKKWNTRDS